MKSSMFTKLQPFVLFLVLAVLLNFQSCNNSNSTTEKEEVSNSKIEDTESSNLESSGDEISQTQPLSKEKLDVIIRYCEYFNESKYQEISELFAPKVEQFITVKNVTNEAVGKMSNDFLSKKEYVDYSAHIDEAKADGDKISLPIEIRWKGYHAKVLTEFTFNQENKITALKELKILEKRKIASKIKTKKGEILVSYKNCDVKKRGFDCTHYRVDYELLEKAPNAALKDNVNKYILAFEGNEAGDEDIFRAEHQKRGEAMMSDYKDFEEDGRPWHQHQSNHFEEMGDVLTLVESSSEYMGGAHGMGMSTTRHFNMKTGAEIRLNDILVDGFEKKIRPIIQKQMEELGYDFPEQQPLPENFHFGMKHLIFYYNQYELGMYLPAPGFQLEYEEIKDLLKKDSPVYSILKQYF